MGGMNRQHEQKKNLYFGLFDRSGNEQGPVVYSFLRQAH